MILTNTEFAFIGKQCFYQVISPLLLIVRVANGRAHSTTIPSFSTEGPEVRNGSARNDYPTSTVASEISRRSVDNARG
jgi:hypothetical protein